MDGIIVDTIHVREVIDYLNTHYLIPGLNITLISQ